MRGRLLLFACLLLCAGPARSQSPDVSDKLRRISQGLTADYQAKNPSAGKAPLAVFPFSCSEKLEAERVGFAMSELLTHYFNTGAAFTVVERSLLTKVLEEQKLQLSGAIDPDSAVQVGRLLGAKLVLLGSVEKLGGKYQVNARIVETQTGRVVSTAYEALPVQAFEAAAKPYLAGTVPETQAIGFYFLFNYRHNSNSFNAPAIGTPGTLSPKSFPLSMLGGGARYFPFKRLMLDVNVSVNSMSPVFASGTTNTGSAQQRSLASGKVILTRATLNWVQPFGKFRAIAGGGASAYKVNGFNFGTSVVPGLRGGLEYKPQERVGFAVFGNYDFIKRKGSDPSTPGDILMFSGFSIEPTIGFYF